MMCGSTSIFARNRYEDVRQNSFPTHIDNGILCRSFFNFPCEQHLVADVSAGVYNIQIKIIYGKKFIYF